MPVRFCTLASGSSGNSSFLQVNGFGILIDIGLSERLIASRLATHGFRWSDIHAVLLTHTHSDHWNEYALAMLRRLEIPFYCHSDHILGLTRTGGNMKPLLDAGLVRLFEANHALLIHPSVLVSMIPVPHDSNPTFGITIQGLSETGKSWKIVYASDLGEVPEELKHQFGDSDLVALEFNHDEGLQRSSGRPIFLIQRVLSEHGHLSNEQASNAIRTMLTHRTSNRLKCLVQLHLSAECNTVEFARQSVKELYSMVPHFEVITAEQHNPSKLIEIDSD